MVSFIEEMGLHAEGFDDEQIAQIEAAVPDLEHLLAVAKAQLPTLQKIVPDIEQLGAALKPELPRILKLLPTLQMILAQVQKNGTV